MNTKNPTSPDLWRYRVSLHRARISVCSCGNIQITKHQSCRAEARAQQTNFGHLWKTQLQHLHLSRTCMITYAISVFRRMSPRYLDNCNRRKSPRIVIGESRQTYTNNMLAKNCRRDSPFEKRIKGRSSSNIYKQLYAWALGVLRHIHIYIYMIIKDRQRNMLACALTATFSCLGKVQIFR